MKENTSVIANYLTKYLADDSFERKSKALFTDDAISGLELWEIGVLEHLRVLDILNIIISEANSPTANVGEMFKTRLNQLAGRFEGRFQVKQKESVLIIADQENLPVLAISSFTDIGMVEVGQGRMALELARRATTSSVKILYVWRDCNTVNEALELLIFFLFSEDGRFAEAKQEDSEFDYKFSPVFYSK